ncbi:hypothetical protein BMS3Bbin04_00042 [bacterium BMS3Bbin04]|nr:hypothetical protein BMS3Bbin04_00042 [bacterium BMS3Bbin04]
MGRLIAALSIMALLSGSFQLGLSKIFHMCLMYYTGLVRLLLSWTDPYVSFITHYLSDLLVIRISLSGQWHHVFVVMWILFMRDANVAFSDGRIRVGIVRAINGLCISIVFGILASVDIAVLLPLFRNVQLSTVPYVGIYVYDLTMYAYSALTLNQNKERKNFRGATFSRWRHFRDNATRAHIRFALILSAIALCFIIPDIRSMPFPKGGLLVLAIATLVNLLYWGFRGVRYAATTGKKEDRRNHRSWYARFQECEAGRFALAVGSVFVWILTFIALNIGARILGL